MHESLPQDYLPVLIQLGAAFVVVCIILTLSVLLGPRLKGGVKDDPFECGIESDGDARTPISVRYFMIAILFVLFDVEIIFMYPWAVNFMKLGWFGFVEMLVFLSFLMAGFYYVIRKGILTWTET
ncbi:MAG: NADH-quinone oxidoreductase subunit A [Spirosomataceae bacterium]|jgi:NADH-quinone oxidoreductase subunit A